MEVDDELEKVQTDKDWRISRLCGRVPGDFKLIDELLVELRKPGQTWADLERQSSVTRAAFARLRQAWREGWMEFLTLGIAKYFNAIRGNGEIHQE
jgi:hypothetical protein